MDVRKEVAVKLAGSLSAAAVAALALAGCGAQDGLGAAGEATESASTPTTVGGSPASDSVGTGEVERVGVPCPPSDVAATAGPDGLPDSSFACLGPGPDVVLSGLPARPTVINVWASWCAPCRAEMPMLVELADAAGDELTVLGIDVLDDRAAATNFAAEVGLASVFDATGSTRAPLGWAGPPATYLVDADGVIVHRIYGQIPDRASLRDDVARYLGVEVGDG
ncbi:MAG: TlpA family protein disulfide reductase [Actinobacteria bacterium]|nr:TlpA family protein disulfide reductase [Actinomycetota bacterium]